MKVIPNQSVLRKNLILVYDAVFSIRVLIALFIFSGSEITSAQSPEWDWAIAIGNTGYSYGSAITHDASGNIYTTGTFTGTVDFDPNLGIYNLTSSGGDDIFISKMTSTGNLIWAITMGGVDQDFPVDIQLDGSGNIYTTGWFRATADFDPGVGEFLLTPIGDPNPFTSKLDPSGNFIWAVAFTGPADSGGQSLAIDQAGNVYTTGSFSGTVDFDPGGGTHHLSSPGVDAIFISKLNNSGNFIWAKAMGGSGSSGANAIALDAPGNIYTCGFFTETVDFDPGGGTYILDATGGYSCFISKLDNSGNFIWAKALDSSGNVSGDCLELDIAGNIHLTGGFNQTTDFDPGPGIYNITSMGFTDIFVIKLSPIGNLIWAKAMGGPGQAEHGTDLELDANGNIFTAGVFTEMADFNPGMETFLLSSAGYQDVFVSKLDASGNFLWALSAGGDNGEAPGGITLGAPDHLFVTGGFGSQWMTFGSFDLENESTEDLNTFIAKILNTEGTLPSIFFTDTTHVLCHGDQTGGATAMATGGSSPYIYEWDNGAYGPTISGVYQGIYTVTVTDNNGSTTTGSVTISEPPAISLSATVMNVTCHGDDNGSIQLNITGGVPAYSYLWSNGASEPLLFNLGPGTFMVTVTDDNGCSETSNYIISEPPPIELNLENLSHESCASAGDGMIAITYTGGINPISILWSNGESDLEISGLPPDEYSVTITDDNNCTQTAAYTINPGGQVQVSLLEINHVSCAGGTDGSLTIMANGGTSPYEYQWSNGTNGPSILNLDAGLYMVTATDIAGCNRTTEYIITEPDQISIQIFEQEQNVCFEDSIASLLVTVSGGVEPYASLWSNGTNGFENNNLSAGAYVVTITDFHQCMVTMSTTVDEPPPITANITVINESGAGAHDGSAEVIPGGGSMPYSYLWSNGANTSAISGLSPGIYTVTVTDINGCMLTEEAQVFAYGCALDLLLIPDLTMCEEDTVIIDPAITGGSGMFTYLWSDGSTSDTLVVHQGGEYCVTIIDAANCQDLDCVIINEVIIPPLTCPVTDESAPGANDGAIQCDSLTGITSYLWSNDSTTSSIEGLAPGQYCVTLTEQNGCLATQCFFVQPANCQMTVNSVITDVLCAGDTTGAILLITDNGTAPINYMWSSGDATAAIENLPAGTYSVTVSDVTGCANFNSFTISEPLPLTIGIDSIAPADPSGSGLIWITAAGGTPDYTYQWVDPLGEIIASEDLNNLTQSGNYSLVLTDAAGCVTILDTVYVDQNVAVDHTTVLKSISVYPVPVKDVLIVNTAHAILEAFITGVDGRVYKHFIKHGDNRFDVADLGPGWYVLRMFDGRDWYVARMVK